MNKLRISILLTLLLGFSQLCLAQLKFTGQADTFLEEASRIMASAKLQSADSVAQAFSAAYGGYSQSQKERILATVMAMQQQAMSPVPHYRSYFALVSTASTLDAARQEQLLKACHKALYNIKPLPWTNVVDQYRQFIDRRTLFENKFLRLRVSNEEFSFEYRGGNRIPGDTVGLYAEMNPTWPDLPPGPDPVTDVYGNLLPIQQPHPDLKGALIIFKKLDLNWATSYDSTFLTGTSGTVVLDKNEFFGEGGKFDWSVAGWEPAEAHAILKRYTFKTQIAKLFCDNAILRVPKITDSEVPGTFEFESRQKRSLEQSVFPKFRSFFSDYPLKNTPENVACRGGVSLDGRFHNTSNVFGTPSVLRVTYKGSVVYKGVGNRYEFGDSIVNSPETASTFYWKGDSLTQPGAKFIFLTNQKIIRLITKKSKFEGSPYRDTYHQVEVTSDEVKVRLDSAKIEYFITEANNRVPTIFESLDYFDERRIVALQGLNDWNLMLILMNIHTKTGNNTMHVSELPDIVLRNRPQMYATLFALQQNGYIGFDKRSDQITLLDKIKHYYASLRKKKDYDNIQIPSISPNKPNAVQDLEKREVQMNGVSRFTISDSLGVYVLPKNKEMTLLKDRDIKFDGMISAGVFMTHGKNFKFEYDKFKVDLAEIDSIGIRLPDVRDSATGRMKAAAPVKLENKRHQDAQEKALSEAKEKIKSVKTHGTLFINKPDNKSGKKKMPQYPIFDVVDFSYVYFDAPHILGGAYNQDVYFSVPPFNIDSTASTNLQAISFDGTFHSDDIVPDFKENLRVQPDRSLGFVHKVPKEGYKLYKGNATFFGTLTLNNKGIRGKGEIKYLTSTIKSDDFIFYQDSVTAKGNTFVLKEANNEMGNFPDAVTAEFSMKWLPKRDSLIVRNNPEKGPFRMYKGSTTLDGQLVLSSGGVVRGGGVVKRQGSQVKSNDMTFAIDNFKGREANFEIESSTEGKPAMKSTNVKFRYDMVAKKAEFETEVSGFASNEFPYTQFKTSIPKAIWDFDKGIITMSKPDSIELANSIFYSTLPELDSINFQAKQAVYNLRDYTLSITGVPFIHVADAEVIPDSGRVEILENAQITPLRNAVLIVDSVNRYHKLVKGEISVKSRHAFEGTALYRYAASDNDTLDINFQNFVQQKLDPKAKKAEKAKQVFTTGEGLVQDDEPIRLIPGVLFKGKVKMIAKKQNLEFDGEIALDLKSSGERTWVKFKKTTDDRNFAVNLKGATNTSGQAVVTGLYYDSEGKVYPLFVDAKRSPGDQELFSAVGTLKPNAETREYLVGKVDKVDPAKKIYEGNVYAYSDTNKSDAFDGRFTFTSPQEKGLQIHAAGAGTSSRKNNSFQMRLTMALEFGLTDNAFKLMAMEMQDKKKNAGLGRVSIPIDSLVPRVGDFAGQKAAEDFRKRYGSYLPLTAVGGKLAKGIVLSDVLLHWSNKHNAWHSVGPIGLGNIDKYDVDASLEGYLEIKKTERGDVVRLFLQATPDSWYYFGYDENKRMLAIATNNSFDSELATKGKAKNAQRGAYAFGLVDDADRVEFVKYFNREYLGREVELTPFVPQIGPAAAVVSEPAADTSATIAPVGEEQPSGGADGGAVTEPAKPQYPINPLTGQPDSTQAPIQPEAKQVPKKEPSKAEKRKQKEAEEKARKEMEKAEAEKVPETVTPAQEVDPITGEAIEPAKKEDPKPAEKPKAKENGSEKTPEKPKEPAKAEPELDPITGQPLAPVIDSTRIKAKLDSVNRAKADSVKKVEEALKLKQADELKKAEEAKKQKEAEDARKAEEERKKKEEEDKKKEEEKKKETPPANDPPLLPPPSQDPVPADSTGKPPKQEN